MMDYDRYALAAASMIGRFGGPARIKRAVVGEYEPVGDARVLPSSTLLAAVSATAATLGLADEEGRVLETFPPRGLVWLATERVYYDRVEASEEDGHPILAGLERGAEGSFAEEHDPWALVAVTHACAETSAVSMAVSRELIARQFAQPGDRMIYLASPGLWFEPRPGDSVRVSGREFRLERVDELSPDGGTSIYFEALGRAVDGDGEGA